MSWDQVGMPEDIVSPGDTIQCKIKGVDKDKRRIYFSLKLMEVGVRLPVQHLHVHCRVPASCLQTSLAVHHPVCNHPWLFIIPSTAMHCLDLFIAGYLHLVCN